jgi:hypothetical protein
MSNKVPLTPAEFRECNPNDCTNKHSGTSHLPLLGNSAVPFSNFGGVRVRAPFWELECNQARAVAVQASACTAKAREVDNDETERSLAHERTKLLETIRGIDLIGRVHLRDAPGTGPRPSERAKEAELAS